MRKRSKQENSVSGAYPIWPLPCDFHGAAIEGAEIPPNGILCTRCTQVLFFTPGDSPRPHWKGFKCKRNTEIVTMNRIGYHVMSAHGSGYWCEALRKVMRQEKFHLYFPAPIVSFIRWKTASDGAARNGGKEFQQELIAFMALSEVEQIALLTGAILQYEYMMEDKHGNPFR